MFYSNSYAEIFLDMFCDFHLVCLSSMCQIPVFKGAAASILGNNLSAGHFHGHDGLGDAPDPDAPGLDQVQKESALSAMVRIINENPGEVRGVTELHFFAYCMYFSPCL